VRTPRRRFRAGAGVGAGVARAVAVVTTGGWSGAATSFTFARAYPNPKKNTLSTVATAVSLSIQTGTVPGLVGPAPSAEGGGCFWLAATSAGGINFLRDARREV
jgi:hypothetical protein